MEQSAVEWQFEQLFKAEKDWAKEVINGMQFIERKYEILAKSKEMEKEKMIDFADDYADQVMAGMNKRASEYYNETLKTRTK